MLRNYLTIALRTLKRNKGYAFLNIAGLAVGFAACLVIGLYLRHELSYDEFHEKAEQIFRLNFRYGESSAGITVHPQAAPAIAERFPEVMAYVRLRESEKIVVSGPEPVLEEAFYYADPSFFDIFSFSLKSGNPKTALSEPYTVVLTEEKAKQYFSKGNALGQTLELRDGTLLRVTGILEEVPANSHIQFDFLASFSTILAEWERPQLSWIHHSRTYFLLASPKAAEQLEIKLAHELSEQGMEATYAWLGFAQEDMGFGLQPITDIHLQPFFKGEIQPATQMRTLYVFGCIALFMLLLACVNYVNLSTARATQRAKEVGMRKVVGAGRGQLARQFLGEAFLTTLAAGLLALVLSRLLLPGFNALMGMELSFAYFEDVRLLLIVCGILLVVSLFAGFYPALVLTRFRPSEVLKGGSPGSMMGGKRIRRGLVVFQFAVSIVIIVGTLAAYNQLRFIQNKPLGYQTEGIVSVEIPDDLNERVETVKAEILKLPGVESASSAWGTPSEAARRDIEYKGRTIIALSSEADADYLQTMQMNLIAGSGFTAQNLRDSILQVVVNETGARVFDLYDQMRQLIDLGINSGYSYEKHRLVGIVSDYHAGSLHHRIVPTFIFSGSRRFNTLVLRLETARIAQALAGVRETVKRFAPDAPFTYEFLDEELEQMYRTERRLTGLSAVFALLAILIACFGLFGLAAFAAEKRTKEIGIRKVLGASVPNLVALLSKDFLKLVLVAFLIAAPVAYYAMQKWLEDFAYRIELGPGLFLVAGALAVFIALVTVSYQAIKAALADPVESLRSE